MRKTYIIRVVPLFLLFSLFIVSCENNLDIVSPPNITPSLKGAPLHNAYWSIKCVNYYPKDYPWGGGVMWSQCDASVYEADCSRMQALGINSVRTFLPVIPTTDQYWYQSDWKATWYMMDKIDKFLIACNNHGIRAIICFDVDKTTIHNGTMNIIYAKNWFNSVITPLKNDSRILAWDIINEPDADPDPNQNWSANMANYVTTMYNYAESLTTQNLTIGMAWRGDELKNIGVSPDIYQFHEYSGGTKDQIKTTLANVKNQWPGKPILVGEYGIDTYNYSEAFQNQIYKNVMDAVSESGGIWGTSCWCLWDYLGVSGAEGKFGILRADGSEKPAVNTVLWYY